MDRTFWLVQTLHRQPWAEVKDFYSRPGVKVKSNPFGYGRMGDYELDYMGSAEFEFGEIPKANNRLAEAGDDLLLGQHEYKGITFDFLWIGAEGKPFADFDKWAKGSKSRRPFYGQETPWRLREVLVEGKPAADCETAVWWSLIDNVQFAFAGTDDEPGHLIQMLSSMGEAPVEFIR